MPACTLCVLHHFWIISVALYLIFLQSSVVHAQSFWHCCRVQRRGRCIDVEHGVSVGTTSQPSYTPFSSCLSWQVIISFQHTAACNSSVLLRPTSILNTHTRTRKVTKRTITSIVNEKGPHTRANPRQRQLKSTGRVSCLWRRLYPNNAPESTIGAFVN